MPVRTCIGCRGAADQATLRRFALTPAGEVVRDDDRRRPGRGAYVHDDPLCLERATRRRAWGRAFRRSVHTPPTP